MTGIEQEYQELLFPSPQLVKDISALEGDIIILGAGGKMGPTLARLAKQAIDEAGVNKKVIAASRFSEPGLQQELTELGIETHSMDLLLDDQLSALPDVPNVLYLAGQKFGTTGKESLTWAMNAYLPGRIAQQYKNSNIVVFSTGNVYPLSPVTQGGSTEDQQPMPVGEYAQSCLARERVFQYFAEKNNTPLFIYRLNYANDVSYGVVLELARSVNNEKPIDLRMGYVNLVWQGDANEMAIRALQFCSVPPKIINITGSETVSVRWLAEQLGLLLGKIPRFVNEEAETALLSNAAASVHLFGEPRVTLTQMIRLIANWVKAGGKTIDKPTHFQEREGQF